MTAVRRFWRRYSYFLAAAAGTEAAAAILAGMDGYAGECAVLAVTSLILAVATWCAVRSWR